MKFRKPIRRMFAEPEVDPRTPFQIMQDAAAEMTAARRAEQDLEIERLGFAAQSHRPSVTIAGMQAMLMRQPGFTRDIQEHLNSASSPAQVEAIRQTIDRYLDELTQRGFLPVTSGQYQSRVASTPEELERGNLRFDLYLKR